MEYATIEDAISSRGLRLVMVRGLPSPWSQAAKTLLELKRLPFLIAPQIPGDANDALHQWSGQRSAPVVAYDDEPPRHLWSDILFLADRIAPEPRLIPTDAGDRALMFGLSHEICGELGLGWCRRLMMVKPAIESGSPPEGVARMAQRYGYDAARAEVAPERIAAILINLSEQLRGQRSHGSRFLVGETLSALDIYWAAFANTLDPLPDALCPIPADFRAVLMNRDPSVGEALDKALLEHRDFICEEFFRLPMEF
jgi:glutathione S-transferase